MHVVPSLGRRMPALSCTSVNATMDVKYKSRGAERRAEHPHRSFSPRDESSRFTMGPCHTEARPRRKGPPSSISLF